MSGLKYYYLEYESCVTVFEFNLNVTDIAYNFKALVLLITLKVDAMEFSSSCCEGTGIKSRVTVANSSHWHQTYQTRHGNCGEHTTFMTST
jgi:hypothetical protein